MISCNGEPGSNASISMPCRVRGGRANGARSIRVGSITMDSQQGETMRSKLLMLGVVALLGGCASGPPVNFMDVSYPPLNEVNKAYLGDRLVMQGRGFRTDVLEVGRIRGKFVVIGAGQYCRIPDTNEYYSLVGNPIDLLNFVGGIRNRTDRLTYKKETNEVCVDDMWAGCFDSSFGSIRHRSNVVCSDPNSYQQIVEYNGKAGQVLNFTYREISGDRIRAPYTTNFTMDEREGNIITYKGAQLKILKATNQVIEYIVLRNFNEAR
jgi:hypothetical protein